MIESSRDEDLFNIKCKISNDCFKKHIDNRYKSLITNAIKIDVNEAAR